MERRVRLVTLLLLLVAVGSMAVPLALSEADRRTSALLDERDRQLQVLAQAVLDDEPPLSPALDTTGSGSSSMGPALLREAVQRYVDVYREPVLIIDPDRKVLAAAGEIDANAPNVEDAVQRQLMNERQQPFPRVTPWTTQEVLRGATTSRNGESAAVVLTLVDSHAAADDLRRSWDLLAAGCATLLLLAVTVAHLLSRWMMRPVHSLATTVREISQGGRGARVLASGPPEMRDFVVEFNKMSEAVQLSLDSQRQLVSDASHQLRNPLAALRLRAETLQPQVMRGGSRAYQGLVRELDRLQALLDQLLRLARVQEEATGRGSGLKIEEQEQALASFVVAERLDLWRPVAAAQRQLLTLSSQVPAALVGRHDLEQLLDIVLDNATKYAGMNGHVQVAVETREGELFFTVADNGPGLRDEEWGRATERFWRGDPKQPGSGLGLAIAQEISAGHHGSLTLRPRPGGGTEVKFSVVGQLLLRHP